MSFPSVNDQLHSFHQPIASNGLFWTTPIPDDALRISKDGQVAEVVVCDYPVIDQPKFPAPGPTYQATVSVRIRWKGLGPEIGWSNPQEQYQIAFHRATASIVFEASVPELGFSFMSRDYDNSESLFAMIGKERNGFFFQ